MLGTSSINTKRIIALFLLLVISAEGSSSFSIVPYAHAQSTSVGKHTFKVSAYYSPLPNQQNYLRGNYDAEVRLNGRGEFGASGVAVHPGMIAAPKTYPFGTKIQLDGLGVGTVEDRGGAIVTAGTNGHNYDRLDVWMGYGDEGLERALQWGIRVVEGEILSNQDALDTIDYGGLQEQINGVTVEPKKETPLTTEEAMLLQAQVQALSERDELLNSFPANVGVGTSGNQVRLIQVAFQKLGYYRGNIDGVYGYELANAILTFQVSKKIVSSEDDPAAGYFGLKTRVTLIDILMNKKIKIEELTADVTLAQKEVSTEAAPIVSVNNTQTQGDTIIPYMPASQMELGDLSAMNLKKDEPILISVTTTSTVPFIQAEKPRTAEYSDPLDFKTPTISAELIQDVQAKLMTMGYNPGPINGKWNAQTRTAMRQFQIKNKLPMTEKLTHETALSFDTVMRTTDVVWGISGEPTNKEQSKMISELQKYMLSKGIYSGNVDGKLDTNFLKGIKKIHAQDTLGLLFPSLSIHTQTWGTRKL